MADGYDRYENEGGGGGSFVMGLLTGTVLGAGLGMLFAPKSGFELGAQPSEQAGNIGNAASGQCRRVPEALPIAGAPRTTARAMPCRAGARRPSGTSARPPAAPPARRAPWAGARRRSAAAPPAAAGRRADRRAAAADRAANVTDATARTVANTLLAAAGVAAA